MLNLKTLFIFHDSCIRNAVANLGSHFPCFNSIFSAV